MEDSPTHNISSHPPHPTPVTTFSKRVLKLGNHVADTGSGNVSRAVCLSLWALLCAQVNPKAWGCNGRTAQPPPLGTTGGSTCQYLPPAPQVLNQIPPWTFKPHSLEGAGGDVVYNCRHAWAVLTSQLKIKNKKKFCFVYVLSYYWQQFCQLVLPILF